MTDTLDQIATDLRVQLADDRYLVDHFYLILEALRRARALPAEPQGPTEEMISAIADKYRYPAIPGFMHTAKRAFIDAIHEALSMRVLERPAETAPLHITDLKLYPDYGKAKDAAQQVAPDASTSSEALRASQATVEPVGAAATSDTPRKGDTPTSELPIAATLRCIKCLFVAASNWMDRCRKAECQLAGVARYAAGELQVAHKFKEAETVRRMAKGEES